MKNTPSRGRVTDALRAEAARRITQRDRTLCVLLAEHVVFTTDQLTRLAFSSPTTARHRLTQLYRLRILDRFRPVRTDRSSPYLWVLDTLGAEIAAAAIANSGSVDLGRSEVGSAAGPGRRRLPTAVLALAASPQLGHRLGVNEVFAALTAAARTQPDIVLDWWTETRCAHQLAGVVRPDAFFTWTHPGGVTSIHVEYDRGGEPHRRLAAKLDAYALLAAATGQPVTVAFVLEGARREGELHRRTRPPGGVTVATVLAEKVGAGPVWWPLGNPNRLSLDRLPSQPDVRVV